MPTTPPTPAPDSMRSRTVMILGLLVALAVASCAPASFPTVRRTPTEARAELSRQVNASPELAVLFVGNSYSFGVPKAFAKLAASRGKKVRVAQATQSGWTLAKHAASEATLEKIRGGKWDVIVIQEQSRIPSLSSRKVAASMHPPLVRLVEEVRSRDAIPVLYQTWGRRDGDPRVKGDDFVAMCRRLRSGYRSASEAAGGVVIVAVGDAWVKTGANGGQRALFMPDGSHPSPSGDRLTAEVFYQCFFGK